MRIAITGGSTGIGASIAEKYKSAGHEVVVFDIIQPKVEVDNWVQTDLSNSDSIKNALSGGFGPYNALINNAGLPPKENLTEKILLVNFFGFRQFCVGMYDQLSPNSAIVNTASRAGAMWRENIEEVKKLMQLDSADLISKFIKEHDINHVRAYNLSKEFVIVFTLMQTESLIQRNLRMNCISPGAVNTEILDDFKKAFGEQVTKNISRAKRATDPSEVADAIMFLASPQSNWLKGIELVIDGGMSAMATTDKLSLSDIS